MPLFVSENPPLSEAGVLWNLADLLAECPAVHTLVEATGTDEEKKATAREKIVVGPQDGPWDGAQFAKAELETRFAEIQVYAPTAGGSIAASAGFDMAECGGSFDVLIQRIVRESEANTDDMQALGDVYLYFLDVIATLQKEVVERSEVRESPYLQYAIRTMGPTFGSWAAEEDQGPTLWAKLEIGWGYAQRD